MKPYNKTALVIRDSLQQLIDNYLAGKATPDDEERLSGWLDHMATGPLPGKPLSPAETEKLRKKLLNNIRQKTRQTIPQRVLWLRTGIAAAILSLLFAGYLYLRFLSVASGPEYLVIRTGVGERKVMTLADSTRIWVGPNSTLQYPEKYPRCRSIQLIAGEAFFDVTPDANNHFTVLTDSVLVEVLGTSFNIRAYPNLSGKQITVSTGKVSISRNYQQLGILSAGQQMKIYNNGKQPERSTLTMPASGQWMHDRILFDNTPLPEVLTMLENYYDVHFTLEHHQPMLISGALKTDLKLGQVIAVLEELTSHRVSFHQQSMTHYIVQ